MTQILPPRFTLDDAQRAHDEWGCNCGPGALAAIARLTLDEVRPLIPAFAAKGYVNPTMMWGAIERAGLRFQTRGLASNVPVLDWPRYGLARIQWEGPWTKPGSNPRWAYRHTHWVGSAQDTRALPPDIAMGIFDINCINNGSGWVTLRDWRDHVVPWILKECVPRADGKWHITHSIEVKLADAEVAA